MMISSLFDPSRSQGSPEKKKSSSVARQDFLSLRLLQPLFSRSGEAFVSEYEQYLKALFSDSEKIAALKLLLKTYLDLLASEPSGEKRRAALLKQQVLAPELAMAGQAFVVSGISPLILEAFQENPVQGQEILASFLRVFFTDMAHVTATYYQDACARCELRVESLQNKLVDKTLHLENSREGFRSIFENVSSPLCTFDQKGRMLRWNKSFELSFGLEDQEIKGQPFLKVITRKASNAKIEHLIQVVFEGKSKTDVSCQIKSAEEKSCYLSVSAFPVFDTEGKVSFGIAMVYDVTEKKELEQALIRSDKMAAVGTLASGLAHEIGTPMNVILGRAESMLRATEEETTAKGLMIVIEQVDRMTLLIERLLSFARRNPIERKKTDLNRLILNGLEICEQRAAAKGISFSASLDPELKTLWCDGDQILQVIVALFMNALDAMRHKGEIQIQTQLMHLIDRQRSIASSQDKKIGMAQILIKDSGQGIKAQYLDKIFDPFFTTKAVGKGTGLGLSVAHEIIRDHGGRIEVASTPGEGTTFCICLPQEGGSET